MVCGPASSLFCTILSLLGLIFLPILGKLVANEYEPLGELDWSVRQTTAQNCYTGAIIYAVFFVLSASRFYYLQRRVKPVATTNNPYVNITPTTD